MTARVRIAVAAGLALMVLAAMSRDANAYWRGRIFVGVPVVPFVYPPAVVYAPPPVVYAPPPVVYDPNPQPARPAAPVAASSCAAGPYICPLTRPLDPGSPCSCPADRGRVSGTAR